MRGRVHQQTSGIQFGALLATNFRTSNTEKTISTVVVSDARLSMSSIWQPSKSTASYRKYLPINELSTEPRSSLGEGWRVIGRINQPTTPKNYCCLNMMTQVLSISHISLGGHAKACQLRVQDTLPGYALTMRLERRYMCTQ